MLHSDFRRISDLLAKKHRIETVESDHWDSDIEKRKVIFNQNDVTDLADKQTIALLLHEIAHIHYTTKWKTEDHENKELELMGVKALEDIAVEYLIAKDYTNAEEILKETMKEVHDHLKKNLDGLKITPYEKAVYYAIMEAENPGMMETEKDYEKAGKEMAEYITKKKEEIENREKTQSLTKNAKALTDIMLKYLEKPTEQQKKEMINRNRPGGRGNETGNGDEQARMKSKMLNGVTGARAYEAERTVTNPITTITDQASHIGLKLLSILKANNAMKYEGRYRAGKLPNKRLIKIRTARDMRPFTKKVEKNNKSYAFTIAIDISGSMYHGNLYNNKETNHNTKLNWALSSAFMTAEALKIAGVQRKIIYFGDQAKALETGEKEQVRWTELANIPLDIGGGTNFDNAIKESLNTLENMSAERKILIMLTDGEDNISDDTRRRMENAKKEGIEYVGITLTDRYENDEEEEWNNDDDDDLHKPVLTEAFGTGNNLVLNTEKATDVGEAFIKILENKITKYED
jgi:hypothetical protein